MNQIALSLLGGKYWNLQISKAFVTAALNAMPRRSFIVRSVYITHGWFNYYDKISYVNGELFLVFHLLFCDYSICQIIIITI